MPEIKRTAKPKILFEENRETFNKLVQEGKTPTFVNQNLSDLDLRGFELRDAEGPIFAAPTSPARTFPTPECTGPA